MQRNELVTPLKINGWNIIPWRFGSDHFPFLSWVMAVGEPAGTIFQGEGIGSDTVEIHCTMTRTCHPMNGWKSGIDLQDRFPKLLNQWDFQGPPNNGTPIPINYSHTTPVRIPKDMKVPKLGDNMFCFSPGRALM